MSKSKKVKKKTKQNEKQTNNHHHNNKNKARDSRARQTLVETKSEQRRLPRAEKQGKQSKTQSKQAWVTERSGHPSLHCLLPLLP